MSHSAETAAHLHAYCERAGDPGLWAEPLNFITNLAFIIYGLLALRWLRGLPDHSFRAMGDIWGLSVCLVLIGLGSGLWHSWALPGWTVIVDTIPIYLFINLYIFSLYRRLASWGWWQIGALWAIFTAASAAIQQSLPMDTLNGSLMYIPTLAFMLISGLYLMIARKTGGTGMLALTGLFFVSLIFRTFDTALCNTFPMGTHFVWHLLNGILLYHLLRLLALKPSAS